jgi:hypothetical protein
LNIRFITGAFGALVIAAGATGAEVVGARAIGAYVIGAKVVRSEPSEPAAIHYKAPESRSTNMMRLLEVLLAKPEPSELESSELEPSKLKT